MNSCIYRGTVMHRRFEPTAHAFRYRLFMLYLDLDEVDRVFDGRWLWSASRPNLAWFRRDDHFGNPSEPLAESVRRTVGAATGRRPEGPVRLLTHLRYLGYCFNPISIYYCFDPQDRVVEAVLAEVTNTPWKERRCYVIVPPAEGRRTPRRFAKALHVSPFLPMQVDYLWQNNRPAERLTVHMKVVRDSRAVLDATLALRREPLDAVNLAANLARFPLMTLKVIGAIHWEAARLWLKGVPVHSHPDKTDSSAAGDPKA